MKNLSEQIDIPPVNWVDIFQNFEEELRKLTGEDLNKNEERVRTLYNDILDYNKENPTDKIQFPLRGTTTDFLQSLEYFRKLFFKKEYIKYVWETIMERRLKDGERNRKNLILITNDKRKFSRNYALKRKPKLEPYAGDYQDDETFEVYNIDAENDNLYYKLIVGRVLLIQNGDNFKSRDEKYDLDFIKDADGKVIKGRFRIMNNNNIQVERNVTKISDDQDGGGGGGAKEKIKDDVWKCINVFLNDNGYVLLSYKLNKPQTWVAISERVNGEKTEYAFDEDYTAYHRTREGEKIIKKGKWECADDNTSFIIKWDNGKVYDPKEALGGNEESEDDDGNGQEDTKKKTQKQPDIKSCKAYSNAPTEKEVLSGQKKITKCMSGPIVSKIQEMPVFQSYLFDVLRGNGESETTDDKFGPYMEKAVKIYQSTNGLYTLNRPGSGVIDKKTYQLLLSQNEKRPGPGPEPPKPPTPTPSPVVQQQTPKPEFSNQKTKF
jgi:peptidoglycan hydrolase-like protein with peptidoglycan-binding domain